MKSSIEFIGAFFNKKGFRNDNVIDCVQIQCQKVNCGRKIEVNSVWGGRISIKIT